MRLALPGDKSISHRALMLAALADGTSEIDNLSPGLDVATTAQCLRQCGIDIVVKGRGKSRKALGTGKGGVFDKPSEDLNAGNSGTTARLLIGLLAGCGITARVIGDESLTRRPMGRVVHPLQDMGARIHISARETLPLTIYPAVLDSLNYTIPVPSAQVKSALLLAALGSKGRVTVREVAPTRNHTENMFKSLGVDIKINGNTITIGRGRQTIPTFSIKVPGDPSSAAFPAAMTALLPNKQITFNDLLLNPTRLGFFRALQRMGVSVDWKVKGEILGEPIGTLTVKSAPLKGVSLRGDDIPTVIDEIPVLAVMASQAKGETVIRDAGELRLKESDRIKAICENLRRMGARIQELSDGFRILGPSRLRAAAVTTYSDHRIAMAFAIAGRVASDITRLDDPDCVEVSYPGYHKVLKQVCR